MPIKNKIATDPLLSRTPPHDLDAEESILSAIFINNNSLHDIIDILSPEDFYKGAHKKIFKVIIELALREEPADLVTVANRLKEKDELESIGGAAYLAAISDAAPIAVNAVHYAKIIHGKASLRQMITAASDIIERCLKDKGDVEEIIDFAESSIFNIAEKKSKSSFQSLGELISLNIDKLEEQQGKDGGLSGLSTGYTKLNNITSGLQKSDLIILAARPSMGKTAFALNMARNVAVEERKPVAVFSLEMSNEQLSMRLLTSEARIDSNRLRTGFINQEDWQNATDAAGVLNDLPIFIDDTPNITAMEIRAKARKLYQKHNEIGLIIIDYLQLMRPPFKTDRRDLEIAEISRSLKALAKELEVPIIALSQLNRMLEQRADKRPMLSDLRESGALEQDADIVAFIYRDEVYNKEADNPKKGTAEIIVAKNRNGATGTAFMHFMGQYTRFEELAPDSYQEFQ
ncbi:MULTISPECIES: replicative DNA helicase [Desulfobacula]|uniref:Replicative DNA helicase n=2 Tax=Desulfobacula TaxID=28222 RepID=K0NNV4_DESTT|nr:MULTISPECIES: replicative DNA helicase [Desulfobacula]CCK80447.1 DnaB: replicative DNA helicase [Desulfobacula toluolica Tol2]SDT97581.1 replicative DNA helicase [Desulfobacula phenolica]